MRVEELAQLTDISAQTIRVGLRLGVYPFGAAFKSDERNKRYIYVIYDEKAKEFFGLTDEQIKSCKEKNHESH